MTRLFVSGYSKNFRTISFLVMLVLTGFIGGKTAPGQPADQAFVGRQNAVLLDLASRYNPDYTGYLTGSRRNFGVHSCYLLAALEAERRGLDGGVSITEAMPRIEQMLQHARENLEAWDAMALPGCGWPPTRSPTFITSGTTSCRHPRARISAG